VVDSFSGLGGFASELAYGMKDEFQCKVPLVLFGCGSYSRYSPSALNEAKLLVSLVDNNIHYIPLHSWKGILHCYIIKGYLGFTCASFQL
jgi:hypothetical protein